MSTTIEQFAVVALLAWLVQLALAYRQARLFYHRVNKLRKLGRTATGLGGGRYRGRVYITLVIHPLTHHVIKAEQLKGWTVFATLKPVPELEGRSLEELLAPDTTIEGLSPSALVAARSAAESLQKSFDKAAVNASAS